MPASDHFWRPLGTMHLVFAVSALAVLASTLWMMAKDHQDEWREYQSEADRLKAGQLNKELSSVTSGEYESQLASLTSERAAAENELAQHAAETDELRAQSNALQGEVDLLTRQTKFKGAERDVARANYDIGVRDAVPEEELAEFKTAYDARQAEYNALALELDQQEARLDELKGELAERSQRRDAVDTELKALRNDEERIQQAIAQIAPDDWFSSFKRWLMLQPIVDGFNSPHSIKQEWLPDLPITYGMATTARFDRCRTCHVNIADFGPGNVLSYPHGEVTDLANNTFAHPFASHPNPDLYLSSTSPHPLPVFGCTICHDGDGSGTSFQNAEHTPDNPAEAEVWAEEHDWHSNHFWEYPMQPDRFIESTCLKCHHSVVELGVNRKYGATAPRVYEGYELVKTFGCFGCHEINGFDGEQRIGPDLRLEPNVVAAAQQLQADPAAQDVAPGAGGAAVRGLAAQVDALQSRAAQPFDSPEARVEFLTQVAQLSEQIVSESVALAQRLEDEMADADREDLLGLLTAASTLGDLDRQQRLLLPAEARQNVPAARQFSARSLELAAAFKADPHPGQMRKVGPSLRHIASKTTSEFIAYWTEMPSRFRPDTNMPQFFHLSNQEDALAEKYQPVQLAAIAAYLEQKSQPIDLMRPDPGYTPDAERGKELFARRGCLACHSHDDAAFAGASATFGPNLSKVHEKIKPGEDGFLWLYTWLRDPMRHHVRTRMPNLFLEPEGDGDGYIDPAADIAAFLLAGGPREFPSVAVEESVLDELVELFARKSLSEAKYQQMRDERAYPLPPDAIKGDEIELSRRDGDPQQISDAEWRERKLQYVGRRTISFYGCYGCHDIPEFETARPIGTALQDWGRKDKSRLAPEHIEEFLHHHTDAAQDETLPERAEAAVERQIYDGHAPEEDLTAAYYYENLLHHGRAGFLWQKLRQPRSYDYRKTETKGYDERLRMPRFPFTEQQIEAIATFVLGLVAEPPPSQYVYRPEGPDADVIEGERLLTKFNCAGCHMLEMPEITYAADPDDLVESTLAAGDYEEGLDLLLDIKPPRNGLTGETLPSGEKVVNFRGLIFAEPDFEEDPEFQEYSFDLWETLQVGEKRLFPGSKMLVPAAKLIEQKPPRGGDFAQWLVPHLMQTDAGGNRALAWQASPPPLYLEGPKVQTPWLYQFLLNPDRLRYTTVLRMPKFNMSEAEARALANYFAAFDGVPYPYQSIPQQQPGYLDTMEVRFDEQSAGPQEDYLATSWKLLNAQLCIKCHSVGGNEYQTTDPQRDIRGPDLDRVAKRLRPDWLMLWLYKPAWITPYTSMPTVFPKNQQQMTELFNGDGGAQTVAARDALMNYHRLMEVHGSLAYRPAGGVQQTGSGGE
jgi:mono/diheme cytochrome c family protein